MVGMGKPGLKDDLRGQCVDLGAMLAPGCALCALLGEASRGFLRGETLVRFVHVAVVTAAKLVCKRACMAGHLLLAAIEC